MKLQEFQAMSRQDVFKLVTSKVKLSPKITPLDKLSRMIYDSMVTECEPLRKG